MSESKGDAPVMGERLTVEPERWPIGDDGLPDASRAWLDRAPTRSEQAAVSAEVDRCLPNLLRDTASWPLGWQENVHIMAQINSDMHAAGLPIQRGGGVEEHDHVRTLLAMRERMAKIAEMHHKRVDPHGGTWGDCAECGLQWPCPTYDWARETSDRDPLLSCWNRTDDDEDVPE